MVGGQLEHFPCVAENEPCPICENGAAKTKKKLVGGLTIIDHRPYTLKNGPDAGKTIPFQRRLYIPTRTTISALQMWGGKWGGLRGMTVDCIRSKDTEANVGNVWAPVEKYDPQELLDTFGEAAKPTEWDKAILYRTAAQLVEMGIVPAIGTVSASKGPSADYTKEL